MIRSVKRNSVLLAVFGALFFAGSANAQVFGLSVGAAVPTSDLSDVAKTGFGGAASLGIMLGESSWMLRAEGGYWKFGEEIDDISGGFAPIRAGLRKYWGESRRFYTGPSFGIYIPTGDLEDAVDSSFGLGPQIGFNIFGNVDLMAEYHTIFVSDDSDVVGIPDADTIDTVSFFTFGVGVSFGSVLP